MASSDASPPRRSRSASRWPRYGSAPASPARSPISPPRGFHTAPADFDRPESLLRLFDGADAALKWGAKWSTLYTEIPRGEATGKLEVRADSQVLKIEHDASGKVTGVVYADKDGKVQRQKAR